MKVLITGATGFLGSRLTQRLLTSGWEVDFVTPGPDDGAAAALTALGARPYIGSDASSGFRAVVDSKPDVVVHLATYYLKMHAAEDIGPLVKSNIDFGVGILEAATLIGAPVVLSSSFFQFSEGRPEPSSLYAATKQALSVIAHYYRDFRGLDLRETVLFDTYGPGDLRDKLVPLLVNSATTGVHAQLGSPSQLVRLVYVDDVAAAFEQLILNPASEITSITSAPVSIREIVNTLEEVVGHPLNVSFREDAPTSDLPLAAGNWPPPHGWTPKYSLSDGFTEIISQLAP